MPKRPITVRKLIAAAAAALLTLAACSSGPPKSDAALCSSYLTWEHRNQSLSGARVLEREWKADGTTVTQPLRRDMARVFVYFALWKGAGSGSAYVQQAIKAENAAKADCRAQNA
jgi:hypothetical protein